MPRPINGVTMTPLERIMSPALRIPCLVGFGLVIAQQATGLPGMTYYCIDIFKEVAPSSLMIAVSTFAVTKCIGSLIMVVYMDTWGRRAPLIGGLLLMFLSTSALFLLFYDSMQRDSDFKWVFVTLLDLFVLGFEFSVGSVTFVLIGEIFPGDVKGEALSLAFIVNFSISGMMLFLLYWEISDIGYSVVWAQFSVMAFVFLFFSASLVPETMNKTLEQIQKEFQEEFDVPDFLAAVEYLSNASGENESDEDELNVGTPLINRSTNGGRGGAGGRYNGDVETGAAAAATTSPLVDNDPAVLRQRGATSSRPSD
jgi:MFS family permease